MEDVDELREELFFAIGRAKKESLVFWEDMEKLEKEETEAKAQDTELLESLRKKSFELDEERERKLVIEILQF